MAKVVIAGHADCPYYSRSELLGDRLVKNLPSFQLHKIVKTPEEWQEWLNKLCADRGWKHARSPIVWRELIDRGGRGVLIGDHNDFQEYVTGYYGLRSDIVSDDMLKIGGENLTTKKEIDTEDALFKSLSKPLHVCVTGAASATCYALLPAMTSGEVFGPGAEINLRLYNSSNEDTERIKGLAMELQDLSDKMLRGVEIVDTPAAAFKDCSAVVFLDELPQEEDESHDAWIQRNSDLFSGYAKHMDAGAKKNVRVLVAGRGPINFNTMMMIKNAPSIPRQNIVALSRVVENRAKAVIGQRLNVNTAGVVDLIVWGSANGQHYIDTSKARVHGFDGAVWGPPTYSVPVVEMVHDNKWLDKEFLEALQTRQEATETALGHRAAACEARAITTMLAHWWNGSPHGQVFSLGVCSDGTYDVPEGLVFSYPVTLSPKGYWSVIQDMDLTEETKEKIKETVKGLVKEMEVIYPPPRLPTPPKPDTPQTPPKPETPPQPEKSASNEETAAEPKATESVEATETPKETENEEPKEADSAEALPTTETSAEET